MRNSIAEHEYQVYLADVTALNSVKEFLATKKDIMSKQTKDKLI